MDGILIIDKPKGMTSHDVIDFVRRNFAIKKAGHTGTLDPSATGVLVVLIGKATKLSSHFLSADKEYEAVMTLGRKTHTGDADGRVLQERPSGGVTEESIRSVFASFEGETDQVPPMVSAIHHKGRRLYELARKGKEVNREPRRINIMELKIDRIDLPEIGFTVKCSKGTYIRKLCDDIGDRLGCGAHLSGLRRLRAGDFELGGSIGLEQLKSFSAEDLERRLLKYE
ncbi:MAG: tRNA pseudouridine(55) synthase TruB [Candidatus Omnitrophota bacterium]|jgi:tRNA pseudouridine55 synthase